MMERLKYILVTYGLEWFGKYYGIYKGFVADNDDPNGLARLKLTVPQVYGKDKVYGEWAYPKGMYAGAGYGSYGVPEKGDAVWVMFENGDIKHPVWEHGWFANGEKIEGANPKKKIFQTPAGMKLEFDDDKKSVMLSGVDKVTLCTDNAQINITKSGINIDAGMQSISVGGNFNVLYALVPNAPAIASVAEIGVSQKVKVG